MKKKYEIHINFSFKGYKKYLVYNLTDGHYMDADNFDDLKSFETTDSAKAYIEKLDGEVGLVNSIDDYEDIYKIFQK